MNSISKKIEERIQELNISQRELAEKVGVTEATISRYIKGERTPRGDIIPKIASALKVTADYLVGDNGIENSELKIMPSAGVRDGQITKNRERFAELIIKECERRNINLNSLSIEDQKALVKKIIAITTALNE